MSQKQNKNKQNSNVIKTEMSPKLDCHQNWNVTKMKFHQKQNATKNEISPKLKCHQKQKCP